MGRHLKSQNLRGWNGPRKIARSPVFDLNLEFWTCTFQSFLFRGDFWEAHAILCWIFIRGRRGTLKGQFVLETK